MKDPLSSQINQEDQAGGHLAQGLGPVTDFAGMGVIVGVGKGMARYGQEGAQDEDDDQEFVEGFEGWRKHLEELYQKRQKRWASA